MSDLFSSDKTVSILDFPFAVKGSIRSCFCPAQHPESSEPLQCGQTSTGRGRLAFAAADWASSTRPDALPFSQPYCRASVPSPYFADETAKPPRGKMMELGLTAGWWGLSKPRVFRRLDRLTLGCSGYRCFSCCLHSTSEAGFKPRPGQLCSHARSPFF